MRPSQAGVHEVSTSHAVEHLPWPYVILALAEWARVLKIGDTMQIAIPDTDSLARMATAEEAPRSWHARGNIYGGHWTVTAGPPERDHDYTRLLIEVLTVLGFGNFSYWSANCPEAVGNWLYLENTEQAALPLGISSVKNSAPLVDVKTLVHRLRRQRTLRPFMLAVSDIAAQETRH
jgi:hypothetical protein